MKKIFLPLCIVFAFITQVFPQDFTGDLPHIPVICVSRFNPESESGKQIYERLKHLGADVLLIPEQGLDEGMFPFGKASIINLTLSDSSHQFDITRYVDAAYSVWEAEGSQSADAYPSMILNQTIGIKVPDSGYVRTRGTIAGTLLRGPGYRQKFIYDSYGEPDRSPMLYTAAFFLKLEIEPGITPDSSEVLAELQVAVKHRQNPDSLIILDQRLLTYEDVLRADTDGWFAMRLMYHLDTLKADAGGKVTDLVEFPVLWKGIEGITLYVDKIVVSEPRGFSLAHDPMVREYFVDVFRDQKNSHLLDKWFAMPRPSFADSQFPYNTIDSLANLAVTLRNEDRMTDIPRPISSVLYLNMSEMESGGVIEPILFPESVNAFSAATAMGNDMPAADRLLRSVNTGLLYGASQIWIDAGVLMEGDNQYTEYDTTFIHRSASMTLMQETIIPRLKGEFGRTMKLFRDPIITAGNRVVAGVPMQLGSGISALSRSETTMDFSVYSADSTGGSSFVYVVNNDLETEPAGDSITFSIQRYAEPYQNYLIRNIITGETETVLKDQTGEVRFSSTVPAGDARLFEIVPAATRKGKRSFDFDETLFHDLLINKGDSLLIRAGVSLTLRDGASIRNKGTMIVEGAGDTVLIDFVHHSGKNGIYNDGTLLIDGCNIRNGVYGIVHQGDVLKMTGSIVSGCGTGLFLYGSEVSPRIVELQECVLIGNSFGMLASNSFVSYTAVTCSGNRAGVTLVNNSFLVSSDTLYQSVNNNSDYDIAISNSLAYFSGLVKESVNEPVMIVQQDALLIAGSFTTGTQEEPLPLLMKAVHLALAGDTVQSVKICNELWGNYPDSEIAALAVLVVRYLSSRHHQKQVSVFLEVLAASAYETSLRLASELILKSRSLSVLKELQERYTLSSYQEKILFALFMNSMLQASDQSSPPEFLDEMEQDFPKSLLTNIAKTLLALSPGGRE